MGITGDQKDFKYMAKYPPEFQQPKMAVRYQILSICARYSSQDLQLALNLGPGCLRSHEVEQSKELR